MMLEDDSVAAEQHGPGPEDRPATDGDLPGGDDGQVLDVPQLRVDGQPVQLPGEAQPPKPSEEAPRSSDEEAIAVAEAGNDGVIAVENGSGPADGNVSLQDVNLADEEQDVSMMLLPGNSSCLETSTTSEDAEASILRLERDRGQLASEVLRKDELISALELQVAQLKATLVRNEEDAAANVDKASREAVRAKDESQAKLAELKKQFEAANREKEAMVMKYALGEKEVLVQRKAKEKAEADLKAFTKEREDLNAKVKNLTTEKTKLQQLADSRLQDISVLKKDVDRWKEEVKVIEAKACVSNTRLKAESDAHRDTRAKLDLSLKHLSEARQEIEARGKEYGDFIARVKSEEENKQKREQTAQREQSAKLIIDAAAASELEVIREKYRKLTEENAMLSVRMQKLERDRLDVDLNSGKLKEQLTASKQQVVDLMAQLAEMEDIRMQLAKSEEKATAKQQEIDRLRSEAVELAEDMAACRRKEAELLEFTQKLTDKNVALQSEATATESKCSTLQSEHGRLVDRVGMLEADCSQLTIELETEKNGRLQETELLAKKLAEKARYAEVMAQQATDAANEVSVLKRRFAASQKELTRELASTKKYLERKELLSPSAAVTRSPSNASLAANDDVTGGSGRRSSAQSVSGAEGNNNNGIGSPAFGSQAPAMLIPDSSVLVEKIVKLQRTMAKKQDKVDFLEEHVNTLLDELRKKNRIIQGYFMGQESGALASNEMDNNKRKMSTSGGIMASLYTSRPTDSSMTLELSLEINQKLQAVLEDTLLKNITLKENINTLGNEIAQLASATK